MASIEYAIVMLQSIERLATISVPATTSPSVVVEPGLPDSDSTQPPLMDCLRQVSWVGRNALNEPLFVRSMLREGPKCLNISASTDFVAEGDKDHLILPTYCGAKGTRQATMLVAVSHEIEAIPCITLAVIQRAKSRRFFDTDKIVAQCFEITNPYVSQSVVKQLPSLDPGHTIQLTLQQGQQAQVVHNVRANFSSPELTTAYGEMAKQVPIEQQAAYMNRVQQIGIAAAAVGLRLI